MIYLDNASSTPPDPRVIEAVRQGLEEHFASPASPHRAGRGAGRALDSAREAVAALAGCRPEEVVFTASATEANNLALKGIFRARGAPVPRLLVSAVEHSSVLHAARTLRSEGVTIEEIGVDSAGRLDPERLEEALAEPAGLVSIQHGNPEVGTLQPVAEISRRARARGALYHLDASWSAGLYPGLWAEARPDLMTLSPHLFHGPAGIAALLVRDSVRLRPQEEGGTEEGGMRGGLPSIALAAGFGVAAGLARQEAPRRVRRLSDLRQRLDRALARHLSDWIPTGHPTERLPGHLSLCIRHLEGEAVIGLLEESGILAGSGSACSRDAGKESPVLRAMRVEPVLARGALEFCLGAFNTEEDVDRLVEVLPGVVERLRRLSPLAPPAPPGG